MSRQLRCNQLINSNLYCCLILTTDQKVPGLNPGAVTTEALITKVVGAFLLWLGVVLVGSQ